MKSLLVRLSSLLGTAIVIIPSAVGAAPMIGMINESSVYVKTGALTTPWIRLTNNINAASLKMYGDRVAFIDSGNNLWLKNGLGAQWYLQTANVSKYALTTSYLAVIKADGTVWLKPGQDPRSPWVNQLIADNAFQVYISPNQLVVLKNNGDLIGKTLNAQGNLPMMTIALGATKASLTDNKLVYVDTGRNVFGKDGNIFSAWWGNKKVIDTRTTQLQVMGNQYCPVYHDDNFNWEQLVCSNIFGGNWSGSVFGYFTTNFDLAPTRIVVKGDNGLPSGDYLRGLESPFTGTNWVTLSTTGTEITTNKE